MTCKFYNVLNLHVEKWSIVLSADICIHCRFSLFWFKCLISLFEEGMSLTHLVSTRSLNMPAAHLIAIVLLFLFIFVVIVVVVVVVVVFVGSLSLKRGWH